jgi:subtilisin family serine protease
VAHTPCRTLWQPPVTRNQPIKITPHPPPPPTPPTHHQPPKTHHQVAGTISAVNQGSGVYGVLPGVKVLPVKVLSDDGYGSMSDIMAALDYVATNAAALNVGVINLSLGGSGSASDPICASIKAAVQRGIVVAVAAGNDGKDLNGFSPAACPWAVTVTAISATTNQPASFSNWLPTGSSADAQRRVITAPGVNIVSTLPDGSYQPFSGTSMATPHVVGCVARCYAAGDCKLADGSKNRDRFLDVVWAKYNSDTGYRWNAGSNPVAQNKYYGPLVWADRW